MSKLLTPEEALRAILDKKEVQFMGIGYNNEETEWVSLNNRSHMEHLIHRKLRLKPQKVKKYKVRMLSSLRYVFDTVEKYKKNGEVHYDFPGCRVIEYLINTEEEFDE